MPEFAVLEIGDSLSLLLREVMRTDNYVTNASSLNFSKKKKKAGRNSIMKVLIRIKISLYIS